MPDDPARGPTAPGHTAERFGFFTDAVFAIAMTLLVIEIPRPEAAEFEAGDGITKAQAFERLWRFLAAQHNAYYAYVLAFSILWIVWRQHHVLLDQVSCVRYDFGDLFAGPEPSEEIRETMVLAISSSASGGSPNLP
jgi:hypothetical protein